MRAEAEEFFRYCWAKAHAPRFAEVNPEFEALRQRAVAEGILNNLFWGVVRKDGKSFDIKRRLIEWFYKQKSEVGLGSAIMEAECGTFTEPELIALQLTVELWYAFKALPQQHPSDLPDFLNAIHTIQRILGWRPLTRSGHLDLVKQKENCDGEG